MNMPASSEHDTSSPSRPSRRAVLGLALGAALGGGGLAATVADAARLTPATTLAATRRPRRRPRYRVVIRTFRNTTPIVIEDDGPVGPYPAAPYPSAITVAGLKRGRLLDLNVTLSGFNHVYPRDVDLLLVAPNGRRAVIMSDVGGRTEVTNLSIVLDDQASAVPTYDGTIGSGRFRPRNDQSQPGDTFPAPARFSANVALATFTGINPNGTWQLYLVDDYNGDPGTITGGWALTIRARVRV